MKIGDVVRLKSGGPWMTVDALPEIIRNENTVHVVWFDGSKKDFARFATDALEPRTIGPNDLSNFKDA